MINRNEFSLWLMERWYLGIAGNWARDLAILIQDQLLDETIKEINNENRR